MPRKVSDTKLDTRSARSNLEVRRKPYWRSISQGHYIGYRKNKTGGSWVARRLADDKKYEEEKLGKADDIEDANGLFVLDFAQAQEKAREWFTSRERRSRGIEHNGPFTVNNAADEYLKWYQAENKSSGYEETKRIINRDILPVLGSKDIETLHSKQLRDWLHKLTETPAQLRSKKSKANYREDDKRDPEEKKRARKATANRKLNVLKALLNHAYNNHDFVENDHAWRKVKPFKNVSAPRIRYLTKDEAIRLMNACEPNFRDLVYGAILTGCRYGELTSMQVQDFSEDDQNVYVRPSKSGKARHVPLTSEGVEQFRRLTMGKNGNDLIFTHEDGSAWGRSHQTRRLEEAAKATKIEDVSFHILRHTYASWLAKEGVPLFVIAEALGQSGTRMVEKHYAHLAPSHVADTIRAHLPDLGLSKKSNVVKIKKA